MVDPHAVDDTGIEERRDQRVLGVEHVALLDAHRGQCRDVEEAAIVQVLLAGSPELQPVVLRGKHGLHVVARHRRPRDRQHESSGVDDETAGACFDAESPRGDGVCNGLAEHREHDAAVRARRVPFDVEHPGGGPAAPLAEQRPPTRVGLVGRDVVRHDVDEQTHPVRTQRLGELEQGRRPAELAAHDAGIDDVIAMGAAGHRLRDGREVEMRDAEAVEVLDELCRRGEVEVGLQLDAICGAGLDHARSRWSITIERAVTRAREPPS